MQADLGLPDAASALPAVGSAAWKDRLDDAVDFLKEREHEVEPVRGRDRQLWKIDGRACRWEALIERADRLRQSEKARAGVAQAAAPPAPPPMANAEQIRGLLARYCRAWADLQSLAVEAVELHHFDLGRPAIFTRDRLPALEQQIARLQDALRPGAASPQLAAVRNWA